jgi:hypothetical protein
LKIAGINIRFICCDNSGESKAFQNECKSKALNIVFELSGRLNATAKLKGNSKPFMEELEQLSIAPD